MRNFFKKAVVVTVVMICAVISVNAQCYSKMSLYAGFGGGATCVQGMSSPVFSVRLGAETDLVFAEVEGSYLSINSVYNDRENIETNTLSTMTVGANIGLKFLSGYYGYLAVMLNTGYALQEDWYHDCCYDPYCGYGCGYGHGYYYDDHRYCGKYYIGVGVKGSFYISRNISLFGEARYQSIPVEGNGRTKWGGIFQGGIAFHF